MNALSNLPSRLFGTCFEAVFITSPFTNFSQFKTHLKKTFVPSSFSKFIVLCVFPCSLCALSSSEYFALISTINYYYYYMTFFSHGEVCPLEYHLEHLSGQRESQGTPTSSPLTLTWSMRDPKINTKLQNILRRCHLLTFLTLPYG